VVGNQVFDKPEHGILQAISRMTSDFLGIDTPVLGAIRASRKVHDSVQNRRPYLLENTSEETAQVMRDIARELVLADVAALRKAREAIEDREVPAEEPRDESLPAPIAAYQRAHERFSIRCKATLIFGAGTLSVGMLDVSEGGARIAIERAPAVGSRAVLILGALPDRPSIPCVVRHGSLERKAAGLEFLADKKVTQRIVTELVRRFASVEPVFEEAVGAKKPAVANA
jgi:hypothetical protein